MPKENLPNQTSWLDHWWDNGNKQIAFSRNNKGFVVINQESFPLEQIFQTGLPAGNYCNILDSEVVNKQCTGTTITVNQDGTAYLRVEPFTVTAIHIEFKATINDDDDWKRTVMLVYGKTVPGQNMFIRGGIDHDYANRALNRDCSDSNDNCAIPIRHLNLKNPSTRTLKIGETHLDWHDEKCTSGTPLDWTIDKWPDDWGEEKRTVAEHGFGEEPLNKYGPNYWMLDVEMDCSKTVDGWFELKSYISNGTQWEGDIKQSNTPYSSKNHFGKCGYVNVFKRNHNEPVIMFPLANKPTQTQSISRLGADYRVENTVFSIWSPDTSNIQLWLEGQIYRMEQIPDANGYTQVYAVTVSGYHHLKPYHFIINGKVARDPYGVMVKPATDNNIVMDMSLTEPIGGWVPHPPLLKREDAVIYEIHIRDFTIDENSGVDADKRGKYLGMVQTGTTYQGKATGLDHLIELGITHVQILPFFDFASCSAKYLNNQDDCYNWGYEPENFNVPEESYSQQTDYVERIRELKTMINAFHKAGIRVIMDVVYNHTAVFGIGGESTFSRISQKYFTETDLSGTGNSVNASVPMVSRLIRDSLEFWAREYHIDGFRFDLLGIFDYAVVGEWGKYLNAQFPERNLLLYGEPWNGFTADPLEANRVRLGTIARIADAHVSVFNPKFREALKGQNDNGLGGGFIFNQGYESQIAVGSRGSIRANNVPHLPIELWAQMFAANPEQSINYVSAHDNLTLRDKILAVAQLNNQVANTDYLERIQKFANGIILTSQGIPFLHGGVEMMRDKQGNHNSYNAPDEINKIRWQWKFDNENLFEYYKNVIAMRRAHPGFRLNSWEAINENVTTYQPRKGVIVNHINAAASGDDWKEIIVIYNAGENYTYSLPSGTYGVAMEKSDPLAGNGRNVSGSIVAEGTAVTVLYRDDENSIDENSSDENSVIDSIFSFFW